MKSTLGMDLCYVAASPRNLFKAKYIVDCLLHLYIFLNSSTLLHQVSVGGVVSSGLNDGSESPPKTQLVKVLGVCSIIRPNNASGSTSTSMARDLLLSEECLDLLLSSHGGGVCENEQLDRDEQLAVLNRQPRLPFGAMIFSNPKKNRELIRGWLNNLKYTSVNYNCDNTHSFESH